MTFGEKMEAVAPENHRFAVEILVVKAGGRKLSLVRKTELEAVELPRFRVKNKNSEVAAAVRIVAKIADEKGTGLPVDGEFFPVAVRCFFEEGELANSSFSVNLPDDWLIAAIIYQPDGIRRHNDEAANFIQNRVQANRFLGKKEGREQAYFQEKESHESSVSG